MEEYPCQQLLGGKGSGIYSNTDGLCNHPECKHWSGEERDCSMIREECFTPKDTNTTKDRTVQMEQAFEEAEDTLINNKTCEIVTDLKNKFLQLFSADL